MLFFIHVDIMNMYVHVYLDISIRIKVNEVKKNVIVKNVNTVRMSLFVEKYRDGHKI